LAIPDRQIRRLRANLVVQFLDAQHRLHTREQCHLVDRLGEVFIRTRFKTGDHILCVRLGRDQNDRDERHGDVGFEPTADLHAVELGHHHVEQNEIGTVLARRSQRLLAIGSLS
jgi:hypothetical protein